MIRLFVGIELPEVVRARLAAFAGGIPNVRWIAPENIHLTLRFIGEVDEDVGHDVDEALAAVAAPAFAFELAGFDTFGNGRRAHTLWAGVERNPALVHLRDKVESALVRVGLAPETRKFSPHVTIARLNDAPVGRLKDFLARNGLFRSGPIPCDRFVLFSSHLGRSGATYAVEADYPLELAAAGRDARRGG